MSEELVIGKYTIDTTGTVAGASRATAAVSETEQRLVSFGGAAERTSAGPLAIMERKFFSLDLAAGRLARSIGLGYFFVATALAIRRMTEELITSTTAWNLFVIRLEELWSGVLPSTIARTTAEIKKAGGESVFSFTEQIKALKLARVEILEHQRALADEVKWEKDWGMTGTRNQATLRALAVDMDNLTRRAYAMKEAFIKAGGTGGTFEALFGLPVGAHPSPRQAELFGLAGVTPRAEAVKGLEDLAEAKRALDAEFGRTGQLDVYARGIDNIRTKAVALGATAGDLGAIGIGRFDFFKLAGIPTPEEFDLRIKGITQAAEYFNRVLIKINPGLAAIGFEGLKNAFVALGYSEEEARKKLDELGISLLKVKPHEKDFEAGMKTMSETVTKGHFAFEALTLGIESMASALADFTAGAHVSFKKALGEMLLSLSKMAYTYALWNLALAAYASTGIGAATTGGTPTQYLQAAALFFAVGAAAGLAAGAFGAGQGASTGGGGGGGRAGAAASSQVAQPPAPTIVQYIFEGTVMTQNPAEFLRWMETEKRKMAGDNI